MLIESLNCIEAPAFQFLLVNFSLVYFELYVVEYKCLNVNSGGEKEERV